MDDKDNNIASAFFWGLVLGFFLGLLAYFLFEGKGSCNGIDHELGKVLVSNDKQLAKHILSTNYKCFTSEQVLKYIESMNKQD